MKSLIKNTLSSQGLKQSFGVTVANIIATGLGAVAIILLARLLSPSEFGVFSVAFSLLAILAKISDVGVNIALQKKISQTFETDKKKALKYFFESAKIKFVLVILITAVALIFASQLDKSLLRLNNTFIIRLTFIFTIILVYFDFLTIVLQSIHSFAKSVVMLIIQAGFKIFAIAALFYSGSKNVTIAFSFYGIGPLTAIIFGYFALPTWLRKGFENAKEERFEVLKLARFTAIAVIAATIADNIDTLLVQKYMTSYDTGLFSAASKIALLFSVVAYSLGSVLNPRVARYTRRYHLEKYLKKTFALCGLVILLFVILIPFSKYLIIISSGSNYLPAINSLQILLISSAVFILTIPYIAVFYALDKPSYFAISGIGQIIILIGSDMILIPSFGINGAAYGRLISRFAVLIYTLLFALISIKKQPGNVQSAT